MRASGPRTQESTWGREYHEGEKDIHWRTQPNLKTLNTPAMQGRDTVSRYVTFTSASNTTRRL